jgi:heme/copper-type cytochrome/quinol oxidase subunit 3
MNIRTSYRFIDYCELNCERPCKFQIDYITNKVKEATIHANMKEKGKTPTQKKSHSDVIVFLWSETLFFFEDLTILFISLL